MASFTMFLAPPAAISTTVAATRPRRVQTFATTTKGSGGRSSEEKGLFEWLAGALVKDQLVETDPILQKVESKSSGTTSKKTTAAPPPPKKNDGGNGGFGVLGGLFAKK